MTDDHDKTIIKRLIEANGRRASDQIPAILRGVRDLIVVLGIIYLVAQGHSVKELLGMLG